MCGIEYSVVCRSTSLHVVMRCEVMFVLVFFFQAEDGIRDLVRSRGLGDVYKRQVMAHEREVPLEGVAVRGIAAAVARGDERHLVGRHLSLIHI